MFDGFDWWIWGTLLVVLLIIGIVINLKDLQELRAQQQLIRDKEAFYVTQKDLAHMLSLNNKTLLLRIHDIIKETNEYTKQNGEPIPLAHQVLEQQLHQSVSSMETMIGEPSKEQQELANEVYADAEPTLV